MSFKEITAVNRLIIELKFKQYNFYLYYFILGFILIIIITIIIIIYIHHALINALSAHIIHINLNIYSIHM